MSKAAAFLADPPPVDGRPSFETILKHGHQDLVQAVAFNGHGDRCATGSVDGKIRVFNRQKDGTWRHCDTWAAHASEVLELQWLPTTVYPNLLASLGIEGRFKLWTEDPSATPGRRFSESTRNAPLVSLSSRSPYLGAMNSSTSLPSGADPMIHPTGSAAQSSSAPPGAATTATPSNPSSQPVTPAYETRNARSPYRSFSIKHLDDTRTTYLALLSADGDLFVYENEHIENLAAFTLIDHFSTVTPGPSMPLSSSVGTTPTASTTTISTQGLISTPSSTLPTPSSDHHQHPFQSTHPSLLSSSQPHHQQPRPTRLAARGEETSFKVRFDPNPEPCYTALRAGVPSDALGLVVAVMDRVRVYRTRDAVRSVLGVPAMVKSFYLAAEVGAPPGDPAAHRGLVRDVAWAPGNIRGYDVIATACQDGWVRVFRLETVPPPTTTSEEESRTVEGDGGEGDVEGDGGPGSQSPWAQGRVKKHGRTRRVNPEGDSASSGGGHSGRPSSSGIKVGLDQSRGETTSTSTAAASAASQLSVQTPVRHVATEISRLDCHRTPVWRVGFDDDGQILASVGDEGRLMCYRQKPDGTWAKSTELAMVRMKMAVP
ncbi:hypothetical protein VTJ04DRAFT_4413 [Mycothermus thermophilus]|uniref:uncharacterized protein n=1 Tax=Humicola insolens TaxID=85995 RepID=UPI003744A4EA